MTACYCLREWCARVHSGSSSHLFRRQHTVQHLIFNRCRDLCHHCKATKLIIDAFHNLAHIATQLWSAYHEPKPNSKIDPYLVFRLILQMIKSV